MLPISRPLHLTSQAPTRWLLLTKALSLLLTKALPFPLPLLDRPHIGIQGTTHIGTQGTTHIGIQGTTHTVSEFQTQPLLYWNSSTISQEHGRSNYLCIQSSNFLAVL